MCRIVAIVLALLFSAFAYSQPSVDNKNDQTPKTNKKINSNLRGTENSPLIIKILPPEKTATQARQENDYKTEREKNERWMMRATIALAIVTAFLAFFTFRLWSATGKLVKETKESSQRQLRAFVFMEKFHVHSLADPKRLLIIPEWKNSGETQTKNMRCHVNWISFNPNIPEEFDFPDLPGEESSRILIGPKATVFASDLVIDDAHVSAAIEGRERIYVWGWADYDDIFSGSYRHRTEFCNEVVITRIASGEARVRFRLHNKHNGADEECLKKPASYMP